MEDISIQDNPKIAMVTLDNGEEYYLCDNIVTAQNETRNYWIELADNNPDEFICIIGEKRLLKWALDESDEYGISSFEEFIERVGEYPEEHLAGYDFVEINDIQADLKLSDSLGFVPTLAYRHN